MTNNAVVLFSKPVQLEAQSPSEPGDIWIEFGPTAQLSVQPRPPVDLILALPRPTRLERILSAAACCGVDRLVLTGSRKVGKEYFGSHLLKPENRHLLRRALLDGAMQAAADCHLPDIHVARFLGEQQWRDVFGQSTQEPPPDEIRLVAHPPRPEDPESRSLVQLASLGLLHGKRRAVLAIGPEGGWEEAEVAAMETRLGFLRVGLGDRVLRTDYAVPLALGALHQLLPLA